MGLETQGDGQLSGDLGVLMPHVAEDGEAVRPWRSTLDLRWRFLAESTTYDAIKSVGPKSIPVTVLTTLKADSSNRRLLAMVNATA